LSESESLSASGCIESSGGDLFINVTVQPKASRNKIVGIFASTIKIATTAPPVDGKANTQVIALLAKLFEIPKTAICLKSGRQSRKKRFLLSGLSTAAADSLFAIKAGK
jgi:hypothetical protein